MAKVEALSDLDNLQNETSAVQIVNDNNQKIEDAFANTLSLDGSSPNAMQANLDLGSYRLINLGSPVDPNDAVRKTDLDTATGGLTEETIELILNAPTYAQEASDSADEAAVSAALAAAYIGAAVSADHWTSARTITLSGVLSGSQSFDGSANFTLTASLVDGSISAAKLASGVALTNLGYTPANKAGDTFTGEVILTSAGPTSALSAGYRGVPVTAQDNVYTFVLGDAGKLTRHTSATGHAWTIPPNSSVAYPVGTCLVVRNIGTGAVTLTQGAGVTIRIAGSSSTGNKTLAQWGAATLIQEATDVWVAIGSGVS